MKDWSADGLGANVSAVFHVAFTNNREQLYKLIQTKHVLNLNPPMYFHSMVYQTKQPIPTGTQTIRKPSVLASQTPDARKKDFLEFMQMYEIEDVQLQPSDDLIKLFLRIIRFSDRKALPEQQLLPNLCLYVWNDNCPSRVKGLKRVYLDGDEIRGAKQDDDVSIPDNAGDDEISQKSEDGDKSIEEMEVFVVQTYQLIIENK